ncbi:MAG: hypothetical protein ACYSXF_11200, partial [Planctomycetota bacterium]
MAMTPRERVLMTLEHEEPDRIPIVLGASNATGIRTMAYRKLKDHLGFEGSDRFLYDWPELGTAAIDEEVLRRLQSDVRGILDAHPAELARQNRGRAPGAP